MALGSWFDAIGTLGNLPEFGFSEFFNNGNKTAHTGREGVIQAPKPRLYNYPNC